MSAADSAVFDRAARGETAAYVELMEDALAKRADGSFHPRAALTAAELFGRFGFCRGDTGALPALVGTLLHRCAYEHETVGGNPDRGCHAGAHALRYLDAAADAGDEHAATALNVTGAQMAGGALALAREWQAPELRDEIRGYDELMARAAGGDVEAILAIIGNVEGEAAAGGIGEDEALVLVEMLARIGIATGDPRMKGTLAVVMLAWCEWGVRHGADTRYNRWLAVSLLAELLEDGHPEAGDALAQTVSFIGEPAVLAAAREHPSLLAFLTSAGGA